MITLGTALAFGGAAIAAGLSAHGSARLKTFPPAEEQPRIPFHLPAWCMGPGTGPYDNKDTGAPGF